MSGHSKWNNIKQKKGSEDKKRANNFTNAGRLITSAVKEGGSSDPTANPTLRTAIEKAKGINMPKNNIDRAMARGAARIGDGGVGERGAYFEITYEAYGPGGVALLIAMVTDNKNRSAAEIKNLLGRFGASLGEPGSAAYAFSGGKPVFTVPLEKKEGFLKLLDEIDDMEDVVEVLHNAEI